MKSKLTLRLDEGIKERAKRLAERRGTSVSKIVEDYFRLLLRERIGGRRAKGSGPGTERIGNRLPGKHSGQEEAVGIEDLNTVPDELPPRTRRMLRQTGPAAGSLDLDEDTRTWIDAAHEKHK